MRCYMLLLGLFPFLVHSTASIKGRLTDSATEADGITWHGKKVSSRKSSGDGRSLLRAPVRRAGSDHSLTMFATSPGQLQVEAVHKASHNDAIRDAAGGGERQQPIGIVSRSSERGTFRRGYPDLNVADFGAKGDGISDSTQAFRAAIAQVQQANGGTLRVPSGKFRSAPLQLTSHMTLFLERGAVLQAIDDFDLYRVIEPLESYGFGREGIHRGRRVAFLFGHGLQDVTITGDGGRIDGSGEKWWAAKAHSNFDGFTLPHLIELQHTKGVEISHLKLQNSPMWTIHPFACTDVVVRDVDIDNPVDKHNTDGINPDSCENVLIEDVAFKGGDDGIAIKSGWDCFGDERGFNRPTRNVLIRNFTVRNTRAAAVAIGSEMSGGVADVVIQGLRVEKAGAGGALCIKTTAARGGYVRNITLQGLELGEVAGAEGQVAGLMIAGRLGNWIPERNPACREEQRLPEITDIHFHGVRQLPETRIRGPAIRLEGLQEGQVLRNVVLEHVNLISSAAVPVICSNAEVSVKGGVSFTQGQSLAHDFSKETWTSGVGCMLNMHD